MGITSGMARQETNALLQTMNQSLAYAEFSLDGTIVYASDKYLEISGYTKEELIGQNHKVLCLGEHILSTEYMDHWNALKAGARVSNLFRRVRKDGSPFWVNASYHTRPSRQGVPGSVIKFCMDVTGRVEPITQRLSRLDAVERHFITAVFSPDGTVCEVNENFATAVGYTREDLEGKNLKKIGKNNAFYPEGLEEMWSSARSGNLYASLLPWITEDGTQIWLDMIFCPIFCDLGHLEKIFMIAQDTTHKVQSENETNRRQRKMAAAIVNTGHAIVIADKNNKILYVNPSFTEMFGYTESDLAGKSMAFILGPGEQAYLAATREHFTAREAFSDEEIAYCKNGRRLWVSLLATPIFDQGDKRQCTVNVITDVTNGKLSELLQTKALEGMAHDVPAVQLLQLICLEIERVLPGLHVAVFTGEQKGEISLISATNNILNLLQDLPVGIPVGSFPSSKAAALGEVVVEKSIRESSYPEHIRALFAQMGINACVAHPFKNSAGDVVGVVTFYQLTEGENGEALKSLGVIMARICTTIMEREDNKAKMRMLTFYDPITDLPNRDLLIATAEQCIASGQQRNPSFTAAVICINVDGFKNIIRVSSTAQVDSILCKIAKRLREVAGKNDILGRMFSDQFVIVVPGCTAKEALEKAQRVQSHISVPFIFDELEISLTVSIGISMYPKNGRSVETLVTCAHAGTSQSRGKSNESINFFSKDQNARARASFSLEARLRRALKNESLYLCYQPQVNLQSGRLHGAEALARWNDPKHGDITPDQFIPLAEKAGLIEKLTDWVLREACRQLGDWRARNIPVPSVSVNLSAPNFRDPNLPEKIVRYLKKYGLKTSDLVLELTEGVLLDNDAAVMDTVKKAHALGFSLSLDDFGTGYSSLSYLRDLPFSEIKLDQSFVRDISAGGISRRLSLAVMHIGRGLNITVLAEGVETMEQYTLLKKQRCFAAQGYLLSKPLRAEDLEQWIGTWSPHSLADQHCLT